MRLQNLATSALAAASFFAAGVTAQSGYVTSQSTVTITKTVERVVQTAYATMSSSSINDTELPHEPTSYPVAAPSASMAPLPHYNGTAPAPSASGTGIMNGTSPYLPQATGNAAATLGSQSYAFAAFAGVIGLAVL